MRFHRLSVLAPLFLVGLSCTTVDARDVAISASRVHPFSVMSGVHLGMSQKHLVERRPAAKPLRTSYVEALGDDSVEYIFRDTTPSVLERIRVTPRSTRAAAEVWSSRVADFTTQFGEGNCYTAVENGVTGPLVWWTTSAGRYYVRRSRLPNVRGARPVVSGVARTDWPDAASRIAIEPATCEQR